MLALLQSLYNWNFCGQLQPWDISVGSSSRKMAEASDRAVGEAEVVQLAPQDRPHTWLLQKQYLETMSDSERH